MIRSIQVINSSESQPFILVTDARDGLGLYKVFSKTKRKHGVKTNKVKIELCAVTPFGMALNPMASSYLKEDSEMLRFFYIDNRGVVKVFKIPKPGASNSAKTQSSISDMTLCSITTHTGLSLVRKFIRHEDKLIAFDITGQLIKLNITPDINYFIAQSLEEEKAIRRAAEKCIPTETLNDG